jgi:hypothetical protein
VGIHIKTRDQGGERQIRCREGEGMSIEGEGISEREKECPYESTQKSDITGWQ